MVVLVGTLTQDRELPTNELNRRLGTSLAKGNTCDGLS